MPPQNAPSIDMAALTQAVQNAAQGQPIDPNTPFAQTAGMGAPQAPMGVAAEIAAPPDIDAIAAQMSGSAAGEGAVMPSLPSPAAPSQPPQPSAGPQFPPGVPQAPDINALLAPPFPDAGPLTPPPNSPTPGQAPWAPQQPPGQPPAATQQLIIPGSVEQPANPADPGTPPPADPNAPEPIDINKLYALALGHDPDVDEIVGTIDVATRLAALDPTQRAWVEGIMSGRLNPADIDRALQEAQQARSQPQPMPLALQPPPTSPSFPRPGDPDYDPFNPQHVNPPAPTVDPRVEWERARLEQERQAFEAQQQQFAAQRRAYEEEQNARIRAAAQVAFDEIETRYPTLTKEELIVVKQRAATSDLFMPLIRQTGDPKAAMQQTIDNVLLTHPDLRNHLLAGQGANMPPTDVELARQNAANALATSSTGGGGGVSGPSAPPRPSNPASLTQVAIPQQFAPASQQFVQGPVQPGMSPLSPTPATPALPGPNDNPTLAMAQMIDQIVRSGQ